MKCPNCSAECSDQAVACDFCGYSFVATSEPISESELPPTPPLMDQTPASAEPPPQSSPYQNPTQASRPNQTVPNHLTFAIATAIISTLANLLGCCCFPITLASGIAAIVFALKVDKFVQGGDIAAALKASKTAKMWCWVTTALGILFGLWFVVSLILQATGVMDPEAMQEMLKHMGR